ncbi:MOG protein, partial [Centropus unirufus]|nr:MOG protein [Centropus unirufus]
GQSDTTCHAFVGETVVLPCTTTSPGELTLSRSMLYWQIDSVDSVNSVLVHFFHNGKDSLTYQDKDYHGRTSLFLEQMKHGNFSLKISNIRLLDAAVYTCIYKQTGDHPNKTQKSQIKLIVSGKTFFLSLERGRHSQISSRSLGDAPRLAMLPLSFHLLVTLGVWHL